MPSQLDKTTLLALAVLAPLAGCGNKAPLTTGPDAGGGAGAEGVDSAAIAAEVEEVLVADKAEKLTAFRSTKELARFLEHNRRQREDRYQQGEGAPAPESSAAPPAPAAGDTSVAAAQKKDAAEDDSITNTQEQGVDEGGIVKTHGDHLVVLRRGRLFTVDVGDRALRPISALDVSPAPGHDAWYDEMLIHGDTIVVVGFSYQVGATELGLFNVDRNGKLSRRDTFFLRSNDYYSSRNYASRLLGNKLVFYMPFHLGWGFDAENPMLPGVAHWDARRGRADDWDLVIDGSEVFKPVQEVDEPVLHTVVTCDLGKAYPLLEPRRDVSRCDRYIGSDAEATVVEGRVALADRGVARERAAS